MTGSWIFFSQIYLIPLDIIFPYLTVNYFALTTIFFSRCYTFKRLLAYINGLPILHLLIISHLIHCVYLCSLSPLNVLQYLGWFDEKDAGVWGNVASTTLMLIVPCVHIHRKVKTMSQYLAMETRSKTMSINIQPQSCLRWTGVMFLANLQITKN